MSSDTAFEFRANAVQSLIEQGGGSPALASVLGSARGLAAVGRTAFFAGDLVDGALLMQMATVVLDVATSLTPGVSWGRDIYEAVTGENMITGGELSTLERSVAVLGAVSGGIAGEGPKNIPRNG